jgi:hypothetical protein
VPVGQGRQTCELVMVVVFEAHTPNCVLLVEMGNVAQAVSAYLLMIMRCSSGFVSGLILSVTVPKAIPIVAYFERMVLFDVTAKGGKTFARVLGSVVMALR